MIPVKKRRVRYIRGKRVGHRHVSQTVPWIEYEIVRGWVVVLRIFKNFSQHYDCTSLVSRNGNTSTYCITYHVECGYVNRIKCK